MFFRSQGWPVWTQIIKIDIWSCGIKSSGQIIFVVNSIFHWKPFSLLVTWSNLFNQPLQSRCFRLLSMTISIPCVKCPMFKFRKIYCFGVLCSQMCFFLNRISSWFYPYVLPFLWCFWIKPKRMENEMLENFSP